MPVDFFRRRFQELAMASEAGIGGSRMTAAPPAEPNEQATPPLTAAPPPLGQLQALQSAMGASGTRGQEGPTAPV